MDTTHGGALVFNSHRCPGLSPLFKTGHVRYASWPDAGAGLTLLPRNRDPTTILRSQTLPTFGLTGPTLEQSI